jgi:hypothetical protein
MLLVKSLATTRDQSLQQDKAISEIPCVVA